jgi:hypothetical protein
MLPVNVHNQFCVVFPFSDQAVLVAVENGDIYIGDPK